MGRKLLIRIMVLKVAYRAGILQINIFVSDKLK